MEIREINVKANMEGFGVPNPISGVLFGGEDQAHKFIVADQSGEAFAGTVSAKFLRYADDQDVPLTGSIEDGKATVTLIENCYYLPGRFKLTIYVTSGGSTTAVYCCMGTVDRTDGRTTVDPSGEINLDVTDLINRINTAVGSIPPEYTALLNTIAPTFSASTAYAAGQYAWYDGTLYRFTADHAAGAWVGTDATAAVIGEDVAKLKSALNHYQVNGSDLTAFEGVYTILSDGKWSSNANGRHLAIPIEGITKISIEANSSKKTYYAFLTDDSYASGASAAIVSGTSLTEVDAGASAEVTVPSGAVYFYLHKSTSIANYLPSKLLFDGIDFYKSTNALFVDVKTALATKVSAKMMLAAEVSALTSLFDMPIGTSMLVSGAQIKSLESGFPLALLDDNSYKVSVVEFTSAGRLLFDIETGNGRLHYRGTSNSDNTAITWYDMSVAQPLSTSQVTALTSILDVTPGAYFTASGSKIKAIDTTSPSELVLSDGASYMVFTYRYGTNYVYVEIKDSTYGLLYFGSTAASHASNISWYRASCDNDDNAFELYTRFEQNAGWWLANGTLDAIRNHKHTQKLAIRPNTDYYTGYKIDGYDCYGVFYDYNGRKISNLTSEMLTEYQYKLPDGTGTIARSNYSPMFKFTSPADARYISFNFSVLNTAYTNYTYRNYICSKPIFATPIYGDLIIKDNDPVYQKYKDRKLCIIGTSQIMIDRYSRTGKFGGPDSESETQYISGVQEYLMPWWGVVDSYGYSSAPMMYKANEEIKSLYTRVVTDQLDLSNYDDFFITTSSSGLTESNIGDLTSYSDLGQNTDFIGAYRQIIDYIYSLNPKANIFVQTRIIRSAYESPTSYANQVSAGNAVRKMAKLLAVTCVDTAEESGFNYYTAPYWCYDPNGHPNQVGNYYIGMAMRKTMLGI